MNEIDKAYIAGLFDGGGSVDYAKRKTKYKRKNIVKYYNAWHITVAIEMTDQHVLEWLHEVLGFGTLNERKKRPGRKRIWRWCCGCRDALQFAKLIWPHVQVKLHKIEQILDHYTVDDLDPPRPSAKIIYLNERRKPNVL